MTSHLDWPCAAELELAAEYDRYADVYDLFFHGRGADLDFYVAHIRSLLPDGGELLELGTGTGRVAEHLVAAGFRVTGVDFSRAMLERAVERKRRLGDRFTPVFADIRTLALGRRFPLIIAPFGMMAHLVREDERQAVMRRIFEHLEPGGYFVFDDMPSWLTEPSRGDHIDVVGTVVDPASGLDVRASSIALDVADQPLTLCFHYLDWWRDGRLVRRVTVRVVFRNTALDDELAWLAAAGFSDIAVLGGFDGRAFDRTELGRNSRLIIRGRRPAVEQAQK